MSPFSISSYNPNVDVGGGGTLTSGETGGEDSTGPFILFPATETSSNVSPHAVLSFDEFQEIAKALGALEENAPEIDLPESEVEEVPEV